MGCCANAPARTVVQYGSKTVALSNITQLTTLRAQVRTSFPDLNDPFEIVDSNGGPLTQPAYEKALRLEQETKVQVRKLEPHQFSDPLWKALAGSVFKVSSQGKPCIGTGFLVTPQLVLVSGDTVKGLQIKDLSVHFDLETTSEAQFQEGFLVNLNAGGTDTLVLLRLKQKQPEKTPIKLTKTVAATEGEKTTLIYKPVLSVDESGAIQKFDPIRILYNKAIGAGSAGAPIFNKEKGLIGVFVGGAPGTILNSTWLSHTLLELIPSLGDAEKAAVREVLVYSGIPESILPEPQIPAPQPVEPESKEPPFAYSIDLANDSLSLFDQSGYSTSQIKLQHRFLPGISSVLTPEGLVITGPDSHTNHNAALLHSGLIEELSSLVTEHQHHTSVYYKDATIVISGVLSTAVERLSKVREHWELIGDLPEKRAYASAFVFGESIYVLGGVSGNGQPPVNSVYAGDGVKWRKIEFQLPVALKGCGILIPRDSGKQILYGGRTSDTSTNEDIWVLDVQLGEYELQGTFQFAGNLHAYQPVVFRKETLLSSDSGAIYTYNQEKKKFKMLQNGATVSSA